MSATNINFVEWLTARQFKVLRNEVDYENGGFAVFLDATYPLTMERLREEIYREAKFQDIPVRGMTEKELLSDQTILLHDTGRMMASWPNSLHWGLRAAGEPPSPIMLERVADEMRKDRR